MEKKHISAVAVIKSYCFGEFDDTISTRWQKKKTVCFADQVALTASAYLQTLAALATAWTFWRKQEKLE